MEHTAAIHCLAPGVQELDKTRLYNHPKASPSILMSLTVDNLSNFFFFFLQRIFLIWTHKFLNKLVRIIT